MAKYVQSELITEDFMASNGKHYYIIRFYVEMFKKKMFAVLDYDNVDANGHIIKQVHPFEMFISDTVPELIDKVEKRIKVDKLVESGMERDEAIKLIWGD